MDYYQILKVDPSSTQQEIKKSYRKLALQWHPDKTTHTDASQKFKQIIKAYEVLNSPSKRKQYDLKINNHNSYSNINSNNNYINPFSFNILFNNQNVTFNHNINSNINVSSTQTKIINGFRETITTIIDNNQKTVIYKKYDQHNNLISQKIKK